MFPSFSQQLHFLLSKASHGLFCSLKHCKSLKEWSEQLPVLPQPSKNQFTRQDALETVSRTFLQYFLWCCCPWYHQDGGIGIGFMVPCIRNDNLGVELLSDVSYDSIETFFFVWWRVQAWSWKLFQDKWENLFAKKGHRKW